MKSKLLMGIAGLLLASSSMFAGWGVSVGVGGSYYGPRAGVVIAGGAPGYYRPYRYYARPYAVAPVPYGYAVPAPVYAAPPAGVWIVGGWHYGPRGRYWVPGHYGRRW